MLYRKTNIDLLVIHFALKRNLVTKKCLARQSRLHGKFSALLAGISAGRAEIFPCNRKVDFHAVHRRAEISANRASRVYVKPGTPRNTPGTPRKIPGTPLEHRGTARNNPGTPLEHPKIPRNTVETARNTPRTPKIVVCGQTAHELTKPKTSEDSQFFIRLLRISLRFPNISRILRNIFEAFKNSEKPLINGKNISCT